MTTKAAYAPPSAIVRALLSLVLLLGFYVVLFGLAAMLFALPVAAIYATRFNWFTFAFLLFCWTPAVLLVKAAFSTRRPEFEPPPRRLVESEAPALFAAVAELARQAKTEPPGEIYLALLPNLSVTEVGGLFKMRRVMIVGTPLIGFLTVDELRAGIAHELGHFIGGDTRLTTFSIKTHALFESVLVTVERDPFREGTRHEAIEAGMAFARALGNLLVGAYGRLFLRITRSIDRRQELAADALSAMLVGVPATKSALERIITYSPIYDDYLSNEVGYAVQQGAMPTDLLPGFDRMRQRFLAKEQGRNFVEMVKTSVTDKYDSHPALVDRLRALEAFPSGGHGGKGDERPASVLFQNPEAIQTWLVQATRESLIQAVIADGGKVGTLRELPWERIPSEAYAPAVKEKARGFAAQLHEQFPAATTLGGMFAAVFRHVATGDRINFATSLEPALRSLDPSIIEPAARQVCALALGMLFQGALLERGATVEDSLGSPSLVLKLGDERIDTYETMRSFATNAEGGNAELERWAERLGSAP
jgi:Zn-dependent protease with chaperone function